MLTKLISFFMAIVTSLVGMGPSVTVNSLKSVFSNAFSLVGENSSFLEELTDADVSQFDENVGYIKNMMLIFWEEDAGFFSKLDALRATGGVAVGSMPDAQLCVVRTNGLNYEKLRALCEEVEQHEAVALAGVSLANRLGEQYTPNDPFTDYDWYTEYWDETYPGGNNWWIEAIDARTAWAYSDYFEHINIGIVDGGYNTEHEDLAGKIVFPSEKEEKRNNPAYHGSHVAGIIGANADNGVGISGICTDSTLVCVDWTPSDNQLWIADVAIFFGFGKVVKAGARVVNFSLGSSGSLGEDGFTWGNFVKNLDAAFYSCYFAALLSKGYDFVVVQSAGNGNGGGNPVDAVENGCFCPINEKNCFIPYSGISPEDITDRIIIVGSCGVYNGSFIQALSSNVGDRVDICAPGVDVYSCSTDGYFCLSGTSMAAPMVTGVASLVWSADESLSGAQVKEIVCSNTCDTAEPAEYYHFEDRLDIRSYPLVNAKLAVEAVLRDKYEMYEVTVEQAQEGQIVFSSQDGKELCFETYADGELVCLLEKGVYSVSVNGTVIDPALEINADTTVNAQVPEEPSTEEDATQDESL